VEVVSGSGCASKIVVNDSFSDNTGKTTTSLQRASGASSDSDVASSAAVDVPDQSNIGDKTEGLSAISKTIGRNVPLLLGGIDSETVPSVVVEVVKKV